MSEFDQASRFNVESEDINEYAWQAALATHPDRNCQTYYKVFGESAKSCKDTGDERGRRV
jgi:hypothetical protein